MMEIAVLIQQHIMDAYLGHSHKVLGQRGKESLEVQANYANHISAFRPCLLVPLHLCNAFVVAVAHVTDRHTHTHTQKAHVCAHMNMLSAFLETCHHPSGQGWTGLSLSLCSGAWMDNYASSAECQTVFSFQWRAEELGEGRVWALLSCSEALSKIVKVLLACSVCHTGILICSTQLAAR